MAKYILSIDQGTTGSTISLTDTSGQVVGRADKDFPQIFPKPGWVEHNPEEIWGSVAYGIRKVLQDTGVNSKDIVAIGITNQRETVLAWDRKTGRPIGNAIVWQCRRTTDDCKKLKSKEKMFRKKTGLLVDPYFSATKMAWILRNSSEARALATKGELCFGTIDTFLIWRLTGGTSFKTDPSNASRTLLYNLKDGVFDKDLLKIFKLKREMLADIVDSDGDFGKTHGVADLVDGIPITGVLGDQQAALFGQSGFQKGAAKITFGTGSFLLFNTGKTIVTSKKGLLSTVAWKLKGQPTTFALEGGAFVCGAAVQWLRDGLGFFEKSSEVEVLARSVEDSEGVEFVPALAGLGAPYWKPEARGIISGLTRGTTRAHLARATLEAMALQNVDILEVMKKEAGIKLAKVRADGGASENALLMQLQADYLGLTVEVPKNVETTSAGAALVAGLGAGIWSSLKDLEKINPAEKTFKAELKAQKRKERIARWHNAVHKSYD